MSGAPLDQGPKQTRRSPLLGSPESLFLQPVLKKVTCKTSSGSLAERSHTLHKVVELLTLLRTINVAVPDTSFSLAPPHPLPLLLLLLLSLLTSLIWNPSRSSGRRGRTYQLLMYSQCREKARGGRLSNVCNTPVEFSEACFLVFGGKFHEPLNQSFTRLA